MDEQTLREEMPGVPVQSCCCSFGSGAFKGAQPTVGKRASRKREMRKKGAGLTIPSPAGT